MDTNFVDSIYAAVVDSGPELAKKYPELKKVLAVGHSEWMDWEFSLTAASCWLAVLLTDSEADKVEMLAQVSQFDEGLSDAIPHLDAFFRKNSSEQAVNHIMGIWVIVNLARKLPDYKYIYRLAPAIGALAILIVEYAGISTGRIEIK